LLENAQHDALAAACCVQIFLDKASRHCRAYLLPDTADATFRHSGASRSGA